MKTFDIGATYEIMHRNCSTKVKVQSFDPIDRVWNCEVDGQSVRMQLGSFRDVRQIRGVRKSQQRRKSDTRNLFLYCFAIGDCHYKIGVTANVEKRKSDLKTGAAMVREVFVTRIPPNKGALWRKYETELHKALHCFKAPHGGREIFRMSLDELEVCKRTMRSVVSK